jgi:hypothetical protein
MWTGTEAPIRAWGRPEAITSIARLKSKFRTAFAATAASFATLLPLSVMTRFSMISIRSSPSEMANPRVVSRRLAHIRIPLGSQFLNDTADGVTGDRLEAQAGAEIDPAPAPALNGATGRSADRPASNSDSGRSPRCTGRRSRVQTYRLCSKLLG